MTKILVTGVGGGVGQSIVKSFQNTDYSVIGADGEVLGTGLYAVSRAYRIPYASAPEYIDCLLEICQKESCALLFPGLDAELPIISCAAHRFQEIGTLPVVSSPEVIGISDDKLATYQFLIQHGFNAPLTLTLTAALTHSLSFPIVLKPKKGGARSKGVFVVSDQQDLDFKLATLPLDNYVAQEYITGDEYTCGSINVGGRCYGTLVMRRILRDGDTYKAFIVTDPTIHAHVKAVAETLKPFGPCNFQLRLRGGQPYIFEINARCSGTTYSRALAGFNEPLMLANYFLQGRTPEFAIREISVLRYWKELVVDNSRIATMQQHGVLEGDGSQL